MKENDKETRRARLFITGKVQGVFFRARTQEQAEQLGVLGWARNLPDGRVEVLAEGPSWALEDLIGWCRRGPRFAYVSRVEVVEESPVNDFTSFEIIY